MKDKIEEIVFIEIDKINVSRKKNDMIEKKTKTHITGKNSTLDSAELINFLFSVEDKIFNTFKKRIRIADGNIIDNPEKISSISKLIDVVFNKIK